jgi:transcriptional regulator with PAS, ATPase and Fis domain
MPHEMLGRSTAMDQVRDFIELMAENADTTVLIGGESGVGKGLLARSIHARSPRSKGAFVEINCSSLSETLLESELFGYEKGAFTGAITRKAGLIEVADGGTLFLDEISDMPIAVQPKLLTALETGNFRRLGSTRDLKSNVRVIASTNRPLKQVVSRGKFREDLYYRLHVMSIEIPPLRRRKAEDVPVLAEHFLAEFTRARGRDKTEIQPSAMELLLGYDWPGNLRELRNVLERAAILARGASIGPEHLPQELVHRDSGSGGESSAQSLQEVEIAHIRKVLEANDHNHSRSARVLGLHRTTLIDKIKKHGLEPT